MGMDYAWIITTDHLFNPSDKSEYASADEAGITGPSDAPDSMLADLAAGKGKTFRMFDDDGELYYTGRLVASDDAWGTEEQCVAPLLDFGMPNAGAVLIKWHGEPRWTCEA